MNALTSINVGSILVWGFVATSAMTVLLEGARYLNFSRMSLPFLFGAFVTGDHARAMLYGSALYLIGGWLFALLYAWFFEEIGFANWWLGLLLGILHGALLLMVFLPVMTELHPRMATERSGLTEIKQIEPPGPIGLHYGIHTPLVTMIGQLVYGLVMGARYHL
ncbi:MAG: hypothetical protein P8Y53_03745 [Pseudolabrys sp.]|jgi:hypothetical protein